MVFKVSFKETDTTPSKAIEKVGRTTTVILRGTVRLPSFWAHIPTEISEWIARRSNVEVYENVAENTLIIYSRGIAICREDDKYDSLLGERLAEARAKFRIYAFFHHLTARLYDYYDRILFGDKGVAGSGTGSCLAQDIRKYEGLCIREAHHIGELLKDKENG